MRASRELVQEVLQRPAPFQVFLAFETLQSILTMQPGELVDDRFVNDVRLKRFGKAVHLLGDRTGCRRGRKVG